VASQVLGFTERVFFQPVCDHTHPDLFGTDDFGVQLPELVEHVLQPVADVLFTDLLLLGLNEQVAFLALTCFDVLL